MKPRAILSLLAGVLLASPVVAAPPERPVYLFRYHDDLDGRILAEIHVNRATLTSQLAAVLTISAVGPEVDPIPGWQGVHGANLHTAQQLGFILSGRVPTSFRVRALGRAENLTGEIAAGNRGRLPLRRLGPDGRIDFLARTERVYPLEMIVRIPATVPGIYYGEMLVGGVPRLAVVYEVRGQRSEVLEVVSLPDTGQLAQEAKPAQEPKQEDPPYKPPVADRDWDARDVDGKWDLFRRSKARGAHWQRYLAERKDHAFLEQLALYGEMGEQVEPAQTLAQLDAPQWIRTAVWVRRASSSFGHSEAEAQKLIRKRAPAVVRAWLEKYQDEIMRPRGGHVEDDFKYLKHLALPKAEFGKYLPPQKPAQVFQHLDAPRELAEFGQREKAEAGKVYVQQVQRALDALVGSLLYEEPWLGKALTLTKHPNLKVRQSAYLAFTHIGPTLDRRKLPLEDFVKVVDDPREPALVREAALMAYSSLSHPQVILKLHHLLLQPEHPAWSAAVSQLNSLGSGFTVNLSQRLDASKLKDEQRTLLNNLRKQILEYEARFAESFPSNYPARWIEAAAWADHVNDPHREALGRWVRDVLVKQAPTSVQPLLVRLSLDYSPGFPVPGGEEMLQRRVRELAGEILMARKDRK